MNKQLSLILPRYFTVLGEKTETDFQIKMFSPRSDLTCFGVTQICSIFSTISLRMMFVYCCENGFKIWIHASLVKLGLVWKIHLWLECVLMCLGCVLMCLELVISHIQDYFDQSVFSLFPTFCHFSLHLPLSSRKWFLRSGNWKEMGRHFSQSSSCLTS